MSDPTYYEELCQMIRNLWRHEKVPKERRMRTVSNALTTTGGRNREQQETRVCYIYKKVGHLQKDCPYNKKGPPVSGCKWESGKWCTLHGSSTYEGYGCNAMVAKYKGHGSANTALVVVAGIQECGNCLKTTWQMLTV